MRPTHQPAAAALAVVLACSDASTSLTSPDASARAAGDTTATGLPTSVRVTGRILGVSAREPVAGSTDTLRHTPLPHARITLKRNVLVNHQAAQELAGEFIADVDGRFAIEGLRGGHYIIEAAAPGSGYRAGWEYLAATRSELAVDVYLWKE
jgi:hypothetical protein